MIMCISEGDKSHVWFLNWVGCYRDNGSALHSGEARFKYWPGHQLSQLMMFMSFLSPSRQMPG
jgi:hypothetical protein